MSSGNKVKKAKQGARTRPVIGWRERVDLPQLKVFGLKAKVDTGAKTSSLHVSNIRSSGVSDEPQSLQLEITYTADDGAERRVRCRAHSIGRRRVKSSTGHVEDRHVIETLLRIGDTEYPIDITLSDRSDMSFPMLLGRAALRKRFLVDCGRSFQQSKSRRVPSATRKKSDGVKK
jgi:hypothetical protein